MKILHQPPPGGNFGDDLNTWFWRDILPDDVWNADVGLIGIGSVLGSPLRADLRASGAGPKAVS